MFLNRSSKIIIIHIFEFGSDSLFSKITVAVGFRFLKCSDLRTGSFQFSSSPC